MTATPAMAVVPTRRGARLMYAGHVVSEILARPGATHSLFDVMAAGVSALARGPRLALLGFGGGSVIAPLRALGWNQPVEAVDLSLDAALAYSRIAGAQLGDVCVTLRDAAAWLRSQRRRFDVIVEDLSLPAGDDLVMPPVCFAPLPALIAARLSPSGVAIVNVFSPNRRSWMTHLRQLVPAGFEALVVHPRDFDHRLLVVARHLPTPRALAARLRAALLAIRSRQATRLSVRALA